MIQQDPNKGIVVYDNRMCYYSSPQYQASWRSKMVYLYESKGNVQLTNRYIHYRSKKINFDIFIPWIIDLGIGSFSRVVKPVRLNHLRVTYSTPTGPITALLVPTDSAFTPVWETNKIIERWYNIINDLRMRVY